MMKNYEKAQSMVEDAIEHERTCQCSMHVGGRRLSDPEIDALRLLFSTSEGFSVIMGVIGGLIAENEDLRERYQLFVNDWMQRGSLFKET